MIAAAVVSESGSILGASELQLEPHALPSVRSTDPWWGHGIKFVCAMLKFSADLSRQLSSATHEHQAVGNPLGTSRAGIEFDSSASARAEAVELIHDSTDSAVGKIQKVFVCTFAWHRGDPELACWVHHAAEALCRALCTSFQNRLLTKELMTVIVSSAANAEARAAKDAGSYTAPKSGGPKEETATGVLQSHAIGVWLAQVFGCSMVTPSRIRVIRTSRDGRGKPMPVKGRAGLPPRSPLHAGTAGTLPKGSSRAASQVRKGNQVYRQLVQGAGWAIDAASPGDAPLREASLWVRRLVEELPPVAVSASGRQGDGHDKAGHHRREVLLLE